MARQDELFREVIGSYRPALARLARAYEADPAQVNDLLQEIYFSLWKSLSRYESRCSIRTWTYRVAHNVAVNHVLRSRRARQLETLTLDDLDGQVDCALDLDDAIDDSRRLERVLALIRRLEPRDRQIMILYLEGESALSIAEITGMSPGNINTKICRIKKALCRHAAEQSHDQ